MNNSETGSSILNEKTRKMLDIVNQGLARRYRAERRFRYYGLSAIVASLLFLSLLFISIFANGYSAFMQSFVRLNVFFDPAMLQQESLASANYQGLVKNSLRDMFPDVKGRREKRQLYGLVSSGASFQLRDMVLNKPDVIGKTLEIWVPADDDVDRLFKAHFDRNVAEGERRLNDKQLVWIDRLSADGRIEKKFNQTFFTAGDSREPELAGIRGAVVGSFLTLVVTLVLSFPIGVAAAVYLEEFAPKNRWTDLIEVNINNLAAVPSIVFGLLGLAVFFNFFGLPRSAPLVGGLVLTLMTLPTIIIASRSALTSVPPSIREAALGVGASKMQMVAHHVLPPGDAGYVDRDHYRHGARPGGDGPVVDDRDCGFYRRHSCRVYRSIYRATGSDFFVGRQPGAGLCGKDLRSDHGFAGLPDCHECGGRHPAQAF
jgi:phosphate transport system permease protein